MRALGGRLAWAWLAVLVLLVVVVVQLAGASHVVYEEEKLEVMEAAAVPPSIVHPLLRTGYHFQPPKNWINGSVNFSILLVLVEVELAVRACFELLWPGVPPL